ncbi:MAG: hypothetical protein ACYDGR_16575, partial [Candidatus Dormibacteria bacterium]
MGKTTPVVVSQKTWNIYSSILAIVGLAPWLAEKNGMTVPLWLIKVCGVLTVIGMTYLFCHLLIAFSQKKFRGRWQFSIVSV